MIFDEYSVGPPPRPAPVVCAPNACALRFPWTRSAPETGRTVSWRLISAFLEGRRRFYPSRLRSYVVLKKIHRYSCTLGTVNYRGSAFLDRGVKAYLVV